MPQRFYVCKIISAGNAPLTRDSRLGLTKRAKRSVLFVFGFYNTSNSIYIHNTIPAAYTSYIYVLLRNADDEFMKTRLKVFT